MSPTVFPITVRRQRFAWLALCAGALLLLGSEGCSLDWPVPLPVANTSSGAATGGAGGSGGAGGGGAGGAIPRCDTCPGLALTPPSGQVVSVPDGADLQAAIDAALPGEILELEAGATFMGNFVLPDKGGSEPIRIQTSALSAIAPDCTRLREQDVAQLPILMGNGGPALYVPSGGHWQIVGIAMTVAGSAPSVQVAGVGGLATTDEMALPFDVVFDRVLISGDTRFGSYRGITINGKNVTVMNSRIRDLWVPNDSSASHALVINNTPGPVQVLNNQLESSSELVAIGVGAAGVNGVVPTDIVINNNHGSRPSEWNGLQNPPTHIRPFVAVRNGEKVTVEGNVFRNALYRAAVWIAPDNLGGLQPWSRVNEVMILSNTFLEVDGKDFQFEGIPLLRVDRGLTAGNPTDIIFRNNLAYSRTGLSLEVGEANGAPVGKIEMTHNTLVDGSSFGGVFGGPHEELRIRDNVLNLGEIGLFCSGSFGDDCMQTIFTSAVFDYNLLTVPMTGTYASPNNIFVATSDELGFLAIKADDYRLAPTSPGVGKASDGSDMGVDFDEFEQAAMCRSEM